LIQVNWAVLLIEESEKVKKYLNVQDQVHLMEVVEELEGLLRETLVWIAQKELQTLITSAKETRGMKDQEEEVETVKKRLEELEEEWCGCLECSLCNYSTRKYWQKDRQVEWTIMIKKDQVEEVGVLSR
jgi:hypothetical protein